MYNTITCNSLILLTPFIWCYGVVSPMPVVATVVTTVVTVTGMRRQAVADESRSIDDGSVAWHRLPHCGDHPSLADVTAGQWCRLAV